MKLAYLAAKKAKATKLCSDFVKMPRAGREAMLETLRSELLMIGICSYDAAIRVDGYYFYLAGKTNSLLWGHGNARRFEEAS